MVGDINRDLLIEIHVMYVGYSCMCRKIHKIGECQISGYLNDAYFF